MPRLSTRTAERMGFWVFISPWILGFLVFTAGPVLSSGLMSLTNWDIFNPPSWVGIGNFERLLVRDRLFLKALGNTLAYSLSIVVLGLGSSLLLAYFLAKPLKARGVYRILIFLPSVIPVVAASLLFQRVLAPNGLLNSFLALFGIRGPAWLLETGSVLPALALMSLWNVGTSTVLTLAGIQGIPDTLSEAAALDGATKPRIFVSVVLPLLSPVLFFNLVMGIISGLQTFGQVFIMTQGGPDNASMMVVPYLYNTAFKDYRMGEASAMAWILFALILLLSLAVFKSSSLWVYYDSEVRHR